VFAVSTAWTPASLPGLILWAEPDATHTYTDAGTTLVSADGQAVYQLNDKSGNGNHLIQATSGNRPTYKTGSGKPYLQFTAANSTRMDTASNVAAGDGSGQNYMALSIVVDSIASANGIAACTSILRTFGGGDGSTWLVESTGTSEFGPVVTAGTAFTMIGNSGSSSAEVFFNNTTDGATTNSTALSTTATPFTLGKSPSEFLGGRIYAVVYGSGILGSTDRTNLHNYLAALHP
jgi:hypothetical protein